MPDHVRIRLLPLDYEFTVRRGTPLQDVLFPYGVEFPCGGNGVCEGCKVKVLAGHLPLTPEQELMLSRKEAGEGWRLACRCRADEDLTLELAQWEARVLTDESKFEFVAREGLGIAVDLGTTTLAVQLLDLTSGNVLGVATGLNEQGRHGNDVMSRVFFAVEENGQPELEIIIRSQLGTMIENVVLVAGADGDRVRDVAIVGNTVMHHLFQDEMSHRSGNIRSGLPILVSLSFRQQNSGGSRRRPLSFVSCPAWEALLEVIFLPESWPQIFTGARNSRL